VRPGFRLDSKAGATVSFGERCILDRALTVEVWGTLQVGDGTIFGHHCTVGAKESVVIGADCLIADMVSIRDNDHVFDDPTRPYAQQGHVTAPVVIGRNVWLGSKVVVARGVTIGDGAVIGAGAVVTRDIPARAVAVGVPAKVVRQR
jgi:acetyltransferase-like isoleucine patch superfamily enzyme